MSEPVKVPLRGNQLKHLSQLSQRARMAELEYQAAVLAIASAVEGGGSVSAVLEDAEPHVLVTPNDPPAPPKKG